MKIYKLSQSNTIGPVYHGTVYNFKPENIKRDRILFFTDNKLFAHDYASQKSFEAKMDADIRVFSYYIKGNMFDPQNQQHVEAIVPYLPEKIKVYSDFGFSAELTLDKWKYFISGEYIEQPKFSNKDLEGKKAGDPLPDNEVYGKPMSYQLLKLDPDWVYYCREGEIESVINGRYSFRWEMDKNKKYTKEEVANDLISLNHIEFKRKYNDFQRHYDISFYKATRHETKTQNNDVWRWLEGDGVFDAIQKAGFNIVKSREKRNVTYAVFPSAEVIPL